MAEYGRLSGRIGEYISLNMSFYHNGEKNDPYAITKIEMYKSSVSVENLISTIDIVDPSDSTYPSPLSTDTTGEYVASFEVPAEYEEGQYIDVWYYVPSDPGSGDLGDYEQTTTGQFILGTDNWFGDDELRSVDFDIDPLSNKFIKGEVKDLEIGLVPLPLYDYNVELISSLIPHLSADITILTQSNEVVTYADGSEAGTFSDMPMSIGLREGRYRSNPYVLRILIDTSNFYKGTYKYSIKITLPNSKIIMSKWYNFSIV